MPPRFYVPEARAQDDRVRLPDEEAAHLTRVLRLAVGDRISIFNGRGDEWQARVAEASKRGAVAQLESRLTPAPEPRIAITLAIAALKGDKMDGIVRDAVMLGAAAIVPLVTFRTELSRAAIKGGARVARWQRIAVSSAKQCGRAVVPEVHQAASLEDLLPVTNHAILLTEPSAGGNTSTLQDVRIAFGNATQLTIFVGPEGGWSAPEARRAEDSGAMLLRLGGLTLRAAAVPIVALTALRVCLEDF